MDNSKETTHSYRQIVSGTAVFGGVQFMTVVMNIIRGKLVAFLLHSTGMGFMSLLQNAANTIQQFALLGINISAVRNISQVEKEGSAEALAATVRIVRILVLGASFLGLLFTLSLSPLMSQLSFGTSDYTSFFLLLSLSVFFNVMATGEISVMQGLQRYKQLAFCSVVPPVCGLLVSVPIYYFWGIQGIVPAMILSAIIYYAFIRYNSYRNRTETRQRLSARTVWHEGREIIQLGLVMTIGTATGAITTYALTTFISNMGSVDDVGFYQAANFITMQYTSIIFSAMATVFFPKLSSMIKTQTAEAHRLVNQQTEIVLLIVTPLSMLMILTAPILITLLLTNEFQSIRTMIYFMGLASIFKAFCFPMDYIAYASGDKKYILWIETVWGNAKTFTVMALFYYFYGIDGLGYGALCVSIIDALVCTVLIRLRFHFRLSATVLHMLAVMLLLALCCFGAVYLPSVSLRYSVMSLSTAICIGYSFYALNRRLDLRAVLKRFGRKKEAV
jgi:O-antigen/teichoic acid export membrane protein